MRKKLMPFFLLSLFILTMGSCQKQNENSANQTQIITDMAGRDVTVPLQIDKVFSTNPIGTIFMYTIAPEKIVAWNYALNDVEKEYVLSSYQNLPIYGRDDGVNYEAVLASNADIILVYFQTVNDKLFSDIAYLEETLHLPIIAIKGGLADAHETYEFLGRLLGMEDEGNKRAEYIQNLFTAANNMNVENPITLYYGDGQLSLETTAVNSASAQELVFAKVNNVADVNLESESRVLISTEQILAWNPEIVILNGDPSKNFSQDTAVADFMANPLYQNIEAVKNGKVYGVPKTPFSWVGRPIGPNRLIGIQWISSLAYPELQEKNLDDTVKEFYRLFYHIDLTDEDMQKIYKANNTL
ncbi:MAG: ABC transporter substrate-binding protein [Spirochaetales bacterium]